MCDLSLIHIFNIGKPCIFITGKQQPFGIKPAENILYIFLEIPLVFKHSPGRGRNAQLMKPGWNLFACGNCYIVENVIGILIYADAEDCIRTNIGLLTELCVLRTLHCFLPEMGDNFMILLHLLA